MLQIITGKFYGEKNKYHNLKELDLYSNIEIDHEYEIANFVFVSKSNEKPGVFRYTVKFDNCIEQQSGGFSLIDVGSDTVIYQYQDRKVGEEIEKVDMIFKEIIGLKRLDYEKIMECIKSYCASVKLLEEDPNLAYCMLVFALESLSQDYDKYELFLEHNISRLNDCCIENIAMVVMQKNNAISFYWDVDKMEENLETYIKNKHRDSAYLFPTNVEICMYLLASDMLKENEVKRKKWEEKAKFNSVNDKEILDIVTSSESVDKKINSISSYISKMHSR